MFMVLAKPVSPYFDVSIGHHFLERGMTHPTRAVARSKQFLTAKTEQFAAMLER
jgi:hypothetical protein